MATSVKQTPVEATKRIAKEFPEENPIGCSGENMGRANEVRSPRERWREVAEKIQREQDPNKMMELIQRLIAELDQGRL